MASSLLSLKPLSIFLEQKSRRISIFGLLSGLQCLTSYVWVVYLLVTQAGVVKDLRLTLVCLGDASEVFAVIGIDCFWICFASHIPKVIPFRCGQGKLCLDPLFQQQALQIIPSINVSASDVLNLACADDSLSRLMATFRKGSNVRACSSIVSVTV